MPRCARPITIRASSSASRSGCSRCARRRASTTCRSTSSTALAARYAADLGLDRCRRRAARRAGSRRARGRRSATARPRPRCPSGARQAADEARQGGQRASSSRSSSSARTSPPRSPPSRRRPAPHGIDRVEFWVRTNPGHPAGPADEGRLGRRARALSARAQGGAGRPRLGADAGVRRDRYRRRRRGRRRHRRAAGAARRAARR